MEPRRIPARAKAIQANIRVVVVATVADRIFRSRCTADVCRDGRITPSIVQIRHLFQTIVVIYGYHVTLQVLFIPEGLPFARGGGTGVLIQHTNRLSHAVIQEDQGVPVLYLSDQQVALIDVIGIEKALATLADTSALIVVGEVEIEASVIVREERYQLSPFPRQIHVLVRICAGIMRDISQRVVRKAHGVIFVELNIRQAVAPAGIRTVIVVRYRGGNARAIILGRDRFNITCVVVRIGIRLTKLVIDLLQQLTEIIVGILGRACVVRIANTGNVTVLVVGIPIVIDIHAAHLATVLGYQKSRLVVRGLVGVIDVIPVAIVMGSKELGYRTAEGIVVVIGRGTKVVALYREL